MAKDKKDKGNVAALAERVDEEQQPGELAVVADGDRGQRSETVAELATNGSIVTPGAEAPQDEPGPEDFERHSGGRLTADHADDLALEVAVQKRIAARAHVIATRARAKGGANAVVIIAGKPYAPRQRQAKLGGGMTLVELGQRSEASLD